MTLPEVNTDNNHISFLKMTLDRPCPLNMRLLCEKCWRSWDQAKCLPTFTQRISATAHCISKEIPLNAVPVILFLIKQSNVTRLGKKSCPAPVPHIPTYAHMLHAIQHTALCHVYVDYGFYIRIHSIYNFILCIYVYLYYIRKDWSSYKLHKGCRLGRGRRSSSVLSLWKILCSTFLLSKTFHSQHVLKLKAILNTINRHKYTNVYFYVYIVS